MNPHILKNRSFSLESSHFWWERRHLLPTEARAAARTTVRVSLVFLKLFAKGLSGVLETRLVRQVAPDKQFLERHEFESVEHSRGGFGNVL